ncbi:MAG: AMP-binding protein [Lachnospiraceae bacterium]|nr:AMP-binding protein [Lachnospiraceae bacterium]
MNRQRIDEVPYFLDVFEKNLKEDPDKKMLIDDTYANGLSRRQVDDVSGRIYSWLSKKGIGREDFVLICMPRGVWSLAAMIGVWKAGAALTVLEDNYALERIDFIKKDCGCKAVIDMDSWREIQEEDYKEGYVKADLKDAAFAVYTSGSTGNPKGVIHEYGNIKLNLLSSISSNGMRTSKDSRMALIAPLNFVATTKSILNLLYGGYCLYIVPYTISKNPLKLKNYYREERITNTFLSPSIIRAIGGDISPFLKVVHTGSEPANGIFIKGVELVNNYAMSEGAFTICQFEIDREYDVCPVGKPNYDEIKICLLDSDGNEAANGESGEICYENPFFRGYINMPDETEKALKGGLYHSGDIGKFDENGNLILLGRSNDMIKINGNRIEPAEIEAAFKAVTGKEWCAAKGFESRRQSYIALYYKGELDKSSEFLRKGMGKKLPYYMIPTYFMQIEEIPLLPNGKLNRKALPAPYQNYMRGEYIAPRTDLEKKICSAFAKILELDQVGITENFYEIGGDSVSAMEVITELNLDGMSAVDIFQGSTAEKIADLYEKKQVLMENISEEDKEKRARLSPHALTLAQKNILDFQLFSPKASMWIFSFLLCFGPDADNERIYTAAKKIMEWHPIFSTVFEFNRDSELQQRYDESKRADLVIEHITNAELEKVKEGKFEHFKLLGHPMVRLRMLVSETDSCLLIEFHHIVMDGSCVQIIFQNLFRAYEGKELLLDTYYSYLEDEERIENTESYKEARKYYNDNYEGIDWCENIEADIKLPGNINAVYLIETKLNPENMKKFEDTCGFSRNGFMSAVACLALASQSGKKDILTSFIFNNRTDERKKLAGGLLARTIPVGIHLDDYENMAELYEGIRRQSADGIGNCVYDWVVDRENPFVNDLMSTVYETSSITGFDYFEKFGVSLFPMDSNNEAAMHRTMIQAFETEDDISVYMAYMATIYSEERISDYARRFTYIANRLIDLEDAKSLRVMDLLNEIS